MKRKYYYTWIVFLALQTIIHVLYTRMAHASSADAIFILSLPLHKILYAVIIVEILGYFCLYYYLFNRRAILTGVLAILSTFFRVRYFITLLFAIDNQETNILDFPPDLIVEFIVVLFYLSFILSKLRHELWLKIYAWFSLVLFILSNWIIGGDEQYKMVLIIIAYIQTISYFIMMIHVLSEINRIKKSENDEVIDSVV